MGLGVVLLLLLMCVLLGGAMIFLPLFWFADPRTPGCSPGCSKSDPSLSPPPGNCLLCVCYASAMRLLCVSSLSLSVRFGIVGEFIRKSHCRGYPE